jgi:hypothetical protein
MNYQILRDDQDFDRTTCWGKVNDCLGGGKQIEFLRGKY